MKSHSAPARSASPNNFAAAFWKAASVLLLSTSFSANPAHGSPGGELDPAFGDRGRILLRDAQFEELAGVSVFVDPGNGKLLVVADGYWRDALLRFNSDGSLDLGFGDRGVAPLDFGYADARIFDVELLEDGTLLIAGAVDVYATPDNVSHSTALLARVHPDGTLDESFGNAGRATFQLGGVYESLSSILLQADGRIVVLGSSNRSGSVERILARYTKDGIPDAGFGGSATPGIGVIDVAGVDATLAAIVQQSDGKFMACGHVTSKTGSSTSSEIMASRIQSNGVRDSTFGNNGVVLISSQPSPVSISACLELPDGHLLLAGTSGSDELRRATVFRLTPEGRLDASFGANGMAVLDTGTESAATVMLSTTDGSVAIAGTQWKPNNAGGILWADMLVTRIDPISGEFDQQFGYRGMTSVDFGDHDHMGVATPTSIKQQPDGKLVILGSQIDRYDWYYVYSIAIARVDPYGSGSDGWVGLNDNYLNAPPDRGAVEFHVRRTGGSTGQLSVDYRTVDLSAAAGSDYVATSGTVTWADGDPGDKTISITVLNATLATNYEHFELELFNSSGGLAMDHGTVSISRQSTSVGPTTGGGIRFTGSSGSGAIGTELWFLMVLGAVGVARGRTRAKSIRPRTV